MSKLETDTPGRPVYHEDNLLPLSALQHLLFCERQCALIHIEQVWSENLFTAESRIRLAFGLALRSLRLGLVGAGKGVGSDC
jgi:CRISPR-associated exonuclease Cas4